MNFKLINKKAFDTLTLTSSLYNESCEKIRQLQSKLDQSHELQSTLIAKLQGTNAIVYEIKNDKLGNISYVCVQDQRTPTSGKDSTTVFFNGDLNIFVLSSIIFPTDYSIRITDMPYLQATFRNAEVTIIELHCDTDGEFSENKGYGTMMLNALIQIAGKSNCTSISGILSSQDTPTLEKKEKRNGFYQKRGFELSFSDAKKENGSIYMSI